MKFRGLIIEALAMREFMNVSVCLSKLAKDCIMRITKDNVYFIISGEDSGPRRPLVWCVLPVTYYFKEYNVDGVSADANEIFLEFATAMFCKALATLRNNVKSLKIKLTNKQMPCLTMEVDQITGIQTRQCVHDIPVDVIHKKHWGDYDEPNYNGFHVTLQMPPLKPIKNIVDRMKNVSHCLIVSANKDGRLTLRIKTDTVTLSAHFPDLSIESFAVGQIPTIMDVDDTEEEVVTATVDIKKFLMFLTGMQVNNCRTMCSIVHGTMVKLYLEQPGSLSLQCFLTELSI